MTTGTAPFSYQWTKNGIAIPGATTSAYVVPWAQVSSPGLLVSTDVYAANVSNSVGSTLATTVLSTYALPANDNFSAATVITGTEAILRGTTIAATKEAGEPLHAGNIGGSSVWWKWTAPANGIFTVNTVGATFDTVLAIYTGTTLPTLSAVASNDDISTGNTASSISFAATSGTTYYIAVDGKNGATGTFQLQFTDQSDFLPPYPFAVLAGKAGTSGSTNATGTSARFNGPNGIAIDSLGNTYVADKANHLIRMITSAGVVTTLAGTAGTSGTADGTGAAARFNSPSGIAVDTMGNLYVADTGNHTIRLIAPGGVVTTLAGTAGLPGVVDGLGAAARFNGPAGVAVDSAGYVYVADTGNSSIRVIAPGGSVSTFAGVSGAIGNIDGVGSSALFFNPAGIAIDNASDIYVTDTGSHTIRKITPDRTVITFAGTAGVTGSTDGLGNAARFNAPAGICVDAAGTIYVADTGNHTIRLLTASQSVITIAGSAGLPGSTNGSGVAARFNAPRGVQIDSKGNLFIADTGNQTIRKTNLVAGLPVFTTQPASQTVATGNNVTLNAAGTAWNWAYLQWYKDGAALQNSATFQGVNTAHLTIASLDASPTGGGGVYNLVAQNASGSTSSASATVTVVGTQVFTQTILSGNTATFSVVSNPIATYQWQRLAAGTTTWVNISDDATYSGTTTAALTIHGTNFTMNGDQYRAVATSNGLVVDSTPATLSLQPGDMNGDGSADLLWQNTVTGDRAIWTMNNTVNSGVDPYLANIPPEWHMVGRGDFNGDGQTDIVWEDSVTGDHAVWFFNGTSFTGNAAYLAYVPPPWRIAAVADMDGDGYSDLVWENPVTGDRAIWFLTGTSISSFYYLAYVDPGWRICGAADFDGDGHNDLIWECVADNGTSVAGDHIVWLMNGTNIVNFAYVAFVDPAWRVAAVADYTGDGKPDLMWEDMLATDPNVGARVIWEMNGTTFTGTTYFVASVDTAWDIAP
ncbi:MAG TPA: FG-GAP-like repeat-containing protein [Candidatus Didemnitutus sp.]|nr:FG-GAP-like repeat-containing protein [Candidatus Didemnitutus sp.]